MNTMQVALSKVDYSSLLEEERAEANARWRAIIDEISSHKLIRKAHADVYAEETEWIESCKTAVKHFQSLRMQLQVEMFAIAREDITEALPELPESEKGIYLQAILDAELVENFKVEQYDSICSRLTQAKNDLRVYEQGHEATRRMIVGETEYIGLLQDEADMINVRFHFEDIPYERVEKARSNNEIEPLVNSLFNL